MNPRYAEKRLSAGGREQSRPLSVFGAVLNDDGKQKGNFCRALPAMVSLHTSHPFALNKIQ